jgi:hypothetical protein
MTGGMALDESRSVKYSYTGVLLYTDTYPAYNDYELYLKKRTCIMRF